MPKRFQPPFVFLQVSILVGCLLLAGCADGFRKPLTQDLGQAPKIQVPQAQSANISEYRNTPIVRAAQSAGPAVVGITNKAYKRDFFDRQVVEQGSGSGVIFDPNGYIVTNTTSWRARRKLWYLWLMDVPYPDGCSEPIQ